MRTSFRLRPSSARTSSRAALALAGRSITSVTPAPEVTVNFMARSPMHRGAATEMLQRKPRAKGSFDAGRSSIARWRTSVSTINLRLLRWHGQSTQRLRPGNGRRYLEYRLSITFAWFRYSRRFFSSATPSAWSLRARHSRSRVGSKRCLRCGTGLSPSSVGSDRTSDSPVPGGPTRPQHHFNQIAVNSETHSIHPNEKGGPKVAPLPARRLWCQRNFGYAYP